MQKRKRLYPYKMTSQSAKRLQDSLNAIELTGQTTILRTHFQHPRKLGGLFILNWGNSTLPHGLSQDYEHTWINHPNKVANAANKLLTFQQLVNFDVSIPDYTRKEEIAQQWIDEGHRVYGRKTVTGHSGQGIRIFEAETICSPDYCPLYTKNTKAKYEYRIHVMAGEIIDEQQKKKRNDFEGGTIGIRNHANGWVFARTEVTVPEVVREQAIKAVQALGLDFGAVDIGYREVDNKAFVYEVNTAPGLEGTTLEKYTQAIIRNYYGN